MSAKNILTNTSQERHTRRLAAQIKEAKQRVRTQGDLDAVAVEVAAAYGLATYAKMAKRQVRRAHRIQF